jgi:hypothetical protein
MSEEPSREIGWTGLLEAYFASTGEKCHCFSWLHKKAEEYYSSRTIFIDLPVIVLGVLNGSASIGSETLFGDSRWASVGIGIIALITSILNTIGSYFAWSRRAEAHKISSLNYAKMYRFISIEMSLPRHERIRPNDLLKLVKVEYDRLSEISPLIPPPIINTFKQKFSSVEGITFPEETNGLHPVVIFDPAHEIKRVPSEQYADVVEREPPDV